MELAAKVDRTLVSKRETLEKEDEHPSTEYGVFCSRQSTKEFVARSQDDQAFLFEVFLDESQPELFSNQP